VISDLLQQFQRNSARIKISRKSRGKKTHLAAAATPSRGKITLFTKKNVRDSSTAHTTFLLF